MNKIPTLFVRGDDWKVTAEVMPGCEWVMNMEGVATEKLDGTNVMVVFHQDGTHTVHKRRSPNKADKKLDVQPINIPVDEDDKGDGYLIDAVDRFLQQYPQHGLYGARYGEVIGERIQGNRYDLGYRIWIPFLPPWVNPLKDVPRTFEGLKEYLTPNRTTKAYHWVPLISGPMEGIVFHTWHSSAKIKVRDFW